MIKKLTTIVLITIIASTTSAMPRRPKLLRDGYNLSGVDGRLMKSFNDKWTFKLESKIRDDRVTIAAGSSFELLPSAELERITANAKPGQELTCRIWARVTRYKKKNYVFAIYFLPITIKEKKPSNPHDPHQAKGSKKPEAINASDDELKIPPELAAKLAKRKVIRTEDIKKGLKIEQDSILSNRLGYLSKDDNDQPTFVLDGLGRNMPKVSLKLLKGHFLELSQAKQENALERLRFRAAGIVTKYKGENYLLLHRVRRVHSYGNFPY